MHRFWMKIFSTSFLLAAMLAISLATSWLAGPSVAFASGGPSAGHGHHQSVQNPQWLARKQAGLIHPSGVHIDCPIAALRGTITTPQVCGVPLSIDLNQIQPVDVQEPGPGCISGVVDDIGQAYCDQNQAENCGPGATAVALNYWGGINWGATLAVDDHWSTVNGQRADLYWNDTHHHAEIAYLAVDVHWPGQSGWPGEIYYANDGESLGAYYSDIISALNWEASGENSSDWQNFYYGFVKAPSVATLHADIVSDVGIDHKPVIANVWTNDLRNNITPSDWHGNNTGHSIAIIGYNDTAGTYEYVETCGPQCGGTYGIHTIPQSQLQQAILDDNESEDQQTLIW